MSDFATPPRRVGRQPKISPIRIERVLKAVADGQNFSTAARLAGVHPTTLQRWLARGEQALARARATEDYPDLVISDVVDEFTVDGVLDSAIWAAEGPPPFDPDDWLFALFSQQIRAAQAFAEQAHLTIIRRAGDNGDWRASAWFLERTRPEEYGRFATARDDNTAVGEKAAEVVPASAEHVLARIEELRAARRPG